MARSVVKLSVVAMVNGANGLQIANSTIVYGQRDIQKVPLTFKHHLMVHIGVDTSPMACMRLTVAAFSSQDQAQSFGQYELNLLV
jgi:hypothetical protein